MDLIRIDHEHDLEFKIRARRHRLASDMSIEDGGEDHGLAPTELLVGSLGACIAMSVQRYCAECGHGDGDVSVSLAFQLLGKPKRIGAIVVDVELPPGFPEDRIEAVRRVADHCVVHHTLMHPPEVDVEIIHKPPTTAPPERNGIRVAATRRN
jgi:putative redox protein